jgi:hypothetical protein
MSSLAVRRPHVNANRPRPPSRTRRPKSYPDVETRGTLTTGADRLADLFAGAAVLEIARGDDDVTWYWCRALHDRGHIYGLELTKFATGETYQLVMDPEGGAWSCSCPDHVFRGRECKHLRGAHSALVHHGE